LREVQLREVLLRRAQQAAFQFAQATAQLRVLPLRVLRVLLSAVATLARPVVVRNLAVRPTLRQAGRSHSRCCGRVKLAVCRP
jgi:hypothetical protein